MTNSENQSSLPDRYNPNSEPEKLVQVMASNWELLRRVPEFQAVTKKWVGDADFRFQHVIERAVYKDNVHARCALDWMLTPEQRFELAKFQMKNRCFFWDTSANFGPICVQSHPERQTAGIKDCIDDLVDVKPDLSPGGMLTLGQSWPVTPLKFRSQFLSILGDDSLKEINLTETGLTLIQLGNQLLVEESIDNDTKMDLGRYLLQQGGELHRLGQDYKIAAIRRHEFYSEGLIDDMLQRIKVSLPYQAKTGHDLDSKRSFLGTEGQWDKFLAWEAHGRNPYRAAAEFLPQASRTPTASKRLPGSASPSERQRDIAGSIRNAVRAIQGWFPKIYPVRNVGPTGLRRPKRN